MSFDWPEPLVEDLARKRAIIVIGSGVSKNSVSRDGNRRPPLWEEFLKSALERCGAIGTSHIKSAIKSHDYLHACEWLRNKFDDNWVPFLRSEFIEPQYEHCEIHESLFKLDQRVTLTPNFDEIYERYVQQITHGQVIVKNYSEPDSQNFLRDHTQYIVKIHGSIATPHTLIFTQKDYAEARVKNASFYATLDACLLSHTFLFVGCGISDPDINLLLENHNFRFPLARPHYFFTSSKINKDMEHSLRNNRNLKCLRYSPENHHEELSQLLKELVDVVDSRKLD